MGVGRGRTGEDWGGVGMREGRGRMGGGVGERREGVRAKEGLGVGGGRGWMRVAEGRGRSKRARRGGVSRGE